MAAQKDDVVVYEMVDELERLMAGEMAVRWDIEKVV